jgi:hypothetical protein
MYGIFVLKKVTEKVDTHLMSSTFFSINYAIYETGTRNMAKPERPKKYLAI